MSATGDRLEAAWIGPSPRDAPTLVFLHEGLGCVALWRDFPARLADITGCGALVYSRLGYGGSAPCPLPRRPDFMHHEGGDLKARLFPYHGENTHCAFWGWNDVWLHPDFRQWQIGALLPSIHVPVLAIQGETDPYGSLGQLDVIQAKTGDGLTVEVIADCGHAPHLEKPDTVLAAISAFMKHRINSID
ncbi:MAG: alpha/beta hydrolase [Desulfosarcina sp.]|nr:alpha/beta hydrolase [Desulfosarcina sp.]